ncbi:MAG: Spy/CpxP family protein refolding chaperone [Bdellovibrionota bacterium]
MFKRITGLLTNSLTASLMIAVVALPFAAEARGGRGEHGGKGFMKAMEELDLTADQKKKLKEMRAGNKDAMSAKRDAMKAAHEDLKTALQGTASDEDVKKKFETMRAASEDFMRARFDKVLAVRAILTPEQRAKFKGLRGPGGHGGDHDEE